MPSQLEHRSAAARLGGEPRDRRCGAVCHRIAGGRCAGANITIAHNFSIVESGRGIGATGRAGICSEIARTQTLLASAASIQRSIMLCCILPSPSRFPRPMGRMYPGFRCANVTQITIAQFFENSRETASWSIFAVSDHRGLAGHLEKVRFHNSF